MLVDSKDFDDALADYNEALRLTPGVLVSSEHLPYVQHASALSVAQKEPAQKLEAKHAGFLRLTGLWLHLCSIKLYCGDAQSAHSCICISTSRMCGRECDADETGDNKVTQARLLAGRALAWEGLSDWRAALTDYDAALQNAREAGCVPHEMGRTVPRSIMCK